MEFVIDHQETSVGFATAQNAVYGWQQQLDTVGTDIAAIANLGQDFHGLSANHIKSYLQEVHLTLIPMLYTAMQEYSSRFALYSAGYVQEIDSDIHANLPSATYSELLEKTTTLLNGMDEHKGSLVAALAATADLLPLDVPSVYHKAFGSAVQIEHDVQQLQAKVEAYESRHMGDLDNYYALLSPIKALIQEWREGKHGEPSSYTSGQMGSLSTTQSFMLAYEHSVNDLSELEEDLAHAFETLQAQMETYQAEARAEAGFWQCVKGIGAIVVGVVCIVGTAGMATPIVIAAVVVAFGSAAYGIAEIGQGVQEIKFGQAGDITSESSNFLRDTVFGGNQQAYDIFGVVVMTAASLVVPLGGAANAALTAGTSVGQAVIVALGKVVVTTLVSTGAGVTSGYFAGQLWGPEVGAIVGTAVAVVVAVVVAGGLEKLDRAHNWSGFHQAVPVQPNTVRDVEFDRKTVTQDDSLFDPNYVDDMGRTNIQRMQQGLAPKGYDGKSVNIHHKDQTNAGPVAEISGSDHTQKHSELHSNIGQSPSQIDRNTFNQWRNNYWKWRSNNFLGDFYNEL